MRRLLDKLAPAYEKHPLAICLLGAAGLFGLVASTLTLYYNSNDDVLMSEIAAGMVTGTPSEFLNYQNIIMGWWLRLLYSMANGVPWYALQLYGIQLLAAAGLFLALIGRTISLRGVLLSLAAFMVFVLPFLVQLQFTMVSAAAAINGMLLLLAPWVPGRDAPKGTPRLEWGLGGVLLVLSSLVRFKAFAMVGIVMTPALLFFSFRARSPRLMVFLAGVGLTSILLHSVSTWVYASDDGWAAYKSYNAVRTQLHDKPSMLSKKDRFETSDATVLDRVGWSMNDAKCFRSHFYPNPEVFSKERIEYALAHLGEVPWGPEEALETQLGSFRHFMVSVMWLPILLPLIGFRTRKWPFIVVVVTAGVATAIGFYLALFAKLPYRVWLPLYGVAGWLALLFYARLPGPFSSGEITPWRRVAIFICPLILVLASGYRLKKTIQDEPSHAAEQRAVLGALREMERVVPRGVVVVQMGLHLKREYLSPLSGTAPLNAFDIVYAGGWLLHTPLYWEQLRHRGIEDIYTFLATHPNLYVLTRREKTRECFEQYYVEHLPERQVRLEAVSTGRSATLDAALYRVVPKRY